jgi:uncharacterized protein
MKAIIAILILATGLGFGGAARADLQDGSDAYNRGDYATAVQEWRPLAERGNPGAQVSLGYMYEAGEGVLQDYKEAVKWYRKAAEQGFAQAQFNLANVYADGRGVQQDYKEAVKWYRKAAEQDHAAAQFELALLYSVGNEIEENVPIAIAWARRAYQNGNEDAKALYLQLQWKDFIFASDVRALTALVEAVESTCGDDIKCSFEYLWNYIDVTEDRHISLAEIARFQRNIIKYGAAAQETEKLTTEDLAVINLASIMLTPITASAILSSFDYDDDGRLSKKEVTGDSAFVEMLGVDPKGVADEIDFEGLGQRMREMLNQILIFGG